MCLCFSSSIFVVVGSLLKIVDMVDSNSAFVLMLLFVSAVMMSFILSSEGSRRLDKKFKGSRPKKVKKLLLYDAAMGQNLQWPHCHWPLQYDCVDETPAVLCL